MSKVFDIPEAQLITVGQILPDAQWHKPIHLHGLYWEFIYFLQGCGRVETPTETLLPQRYQLVVYPPGLPHAEWTNPSDPESTIYIVVSVPGNCPQGVHLILPDRDGKIRWLADSILSEYQEFACSSLSHTYVQALLQLVERHWTDSNSVNHDFVDATIQYVQMHYALPLSIEMLAGLAHITPAHLAHCFRKKTGTTVMRYVQQVRIDSATRLLATTSEPIANIARTVGFSDPFHFSRVFKRLTGSTPSMLRQSPVSDSA